jgi:hypothetical protein
MATVDAIHGCTSFSGGEQLKLESWLAAGCRLEIAVLRRPLMDENAEAMVETYRPGSSPGPH